jgi:hypothetical protein
MKLTKRFCGGFRGAVFTKKAPLAAGGKNVFHGVWNLSEGRLPLTLFAGDNEKIDERKIFW